MTLSHVPFVKHRILPFLILSALACSDTTTTPPTVNTITVALPTSTIVMGETVTATATGLDRNGAPIDVGTIVWSTSSPDIATVNETGVVTGVAAGTAQVIATAGGKQGQQTITVTAPAAIKVNEVESSGGTPGDWIELYNPTAASVDLSGWELKDNDDTHTYTFPDGSTIAASGYLVVEEASLGFGLGDPDAARLFSKFGVLVDSYTWDAHAATTYGRCPDATGEFTTTTSSTKGAANDCSITVKINEVESSDGTPGDWIELYNAGPTSADLSGFVVKDNDDTHGYTLPAGTTLAAGAYLVVEEASLGFGLGGADAARLFDAGGTLVDSYTWTTHATTTYGRCPDGTGDFTTTTSASKGAANACGTTGPLTVAWPGPGDDVQAVDGTSVFGGNLSGLTYESASGSAPAVLWAAKNGPGTLYRLVWNGVNWAPDTSADWSAGKSLHYTDGGGDADAEGLTFAGSGSAGGIYVASERNNDANTVSRNSVLLFDPNQSGTSLTASHDWNLTSDLPSVGANLGIEAITWIPDSYLTSKHFFDETAGHAYAPTEYPGHGDGLFFVGVEANGMIYAYALDHTTNGFTRIATIATGQPGVMGLEFDRDVGYLWATCDDGCGNKASILEIDTTATSPTFGRFAISRVFDRPTTMPNINNEGFAIAPESECAGGRKYVFWADDGETDGHSVRRATIPCGVIP
jgi:hypothetical protein